MFASSESSALANVMNQLRRLRLQEIIVVVDHALPQEQKAALCRQYGNHTLVSLNEPLGSDVWRAVGARLAQSDILLFVDSRVPVSAARLVPFVRAVARGNDVALNRHACRFQPFNRRDRLLRLREFLNSALGRPLLGADSLVDLPHALSSRAVRIIGPDRLMVPPKAQAAAIYGGLRMVSPANVGVRCGPPAELSIGDHIEALHWAMEQRGERLDFHDTMRRREMAGG